MKFGFVTCVKLGLSCMETFIESGGKLDLAITLPDDKSINKSGRIYIDNFCNQHSIRLLKSTHINNKDVIEEIYKTNIDWLFIVGWSQIASKDLLDAPKRGVIGIHPTLLPLGRGRASIPWAILKDLEKTGVTMFKMDDGVDTGPIISQIEIPLNKEITATELYQLIIDGHIQLIKKNTKSILNQELKLIPQDDVEATIWPGRKPEEGLINFNSSVYNAEKLVRALTYPYPGAFYYKDGVKYIVWEAKVLKDTELHTNKDNILKFNDGNLMIVKQSC